jgi:hypothetical protein
LETSTNQLFILLLDLDDIEVPVGYEHSNRLRKIRDEHRNGFRYFDKDITDVFFSSSRILQPTERFIVQVYGNASKENTTTGERIAFLKSQNAIHLGVYGISLVWEQRRHLLPSGYSYVSFDEEGRLPIRRNGDPVVPCLCVTPSDEFDFQLLNAMLSWNTFIPFFCFTKA